MCKENGAAILVCFARSGSAAAPALARLPVRRLGDQPAASAARQTTFAAAPAAERAGERPDVCDLRAALRH